jgi:hypothetical protein
MARTINLADPLDRRRYRCPRGHARWEDWKTAERESVNCVLGYTELFWPQGLWGVADDRLIDQLLQRLGH